MRAEVRRLQQRLSESNAQLQKVLNVIQEADDNAAKRPEKARSLLSEVRLQTNRLRGSRDGVMPEVAVLSVEDFWERRATSHRPAALSAAQTIVNIFRLSSQHSEYVVALSASPRQGR